VNGTEIPEDVVIQNQQDLLKVQASVKGVIPEDEYNELLKKPFLGVPVYEDFQGYNSEKDGYFLYVDNPSICYSAVMVALANYRNLFLM